MIIKVCGMREPENIAQLTALPVDWVGLIFYPRSLRYVDMLPTDTLSTVSCKITGVFVNATQEEILEKVNTYRLDYVQLHGEESPDFCYYLQKRGVAVIKSFPIATVADLTVTAAYERRADYFLFDTRCTSYGGSGHSFDWSLLSHYTGQTPFLLSGGIHPGSIESIRKFHHPQWAGIDLNSGFETAPGIKDIHQLNTFIHQLKKQPI